MRDIKFRVWDKDRKRMHIVGEFHHDSLSIDEDNNIYYLNLQCMEASPHKGIDPEHCAYRLMQYTGLKDKNGKEIYEGDILLYDSNSKTSVFYKNGAFVRSYGNSNMYLLYDSFIEDGCLYNYEVIGNIYENPELLEGEE